MNEKKKTKVPAEKKPVSPAKAAKKPPAKVKGKPAPKPKRKARPKISPKNTQPDHWLRRPKTIRKLSIGGSLMLAALVAIDPWISSYGQFGFDALFAFNAWFGFLACVAMVFVAKGLGLFLKRRDTYFD